jgi:PPK2 family polyphosphate:nucleotide phosphotransferase
MQASSVRPIPGTGCPGEHQELQSTRHRLRPSNPVGPVNKIKEAMKRTELVKRYRVAENKKFRLADVHPTDTWKLKSKDQAQEWLEKGVARLSELQDRLYAQNQWAVLLIFQAMDAAGKDGTIKHVMSGVNPQGCEVASFKVPSAEELNHDFLWRTTRRLPERGRIGIFNRSYYEEALVLRVHPELLAREKLPPSLITKDIWQERFEDINAFERHLTRNGVLVRKFFLHISKQEQRQRFLSRLELPQKNWKFSLSDLRERQKWGAYMKAYEQVIRNTATDCAPWYVVPADHKWFTRLVVAEVVVNALESLDLSYPKVSSAKRKELAAIRTALRINKA